MHKLPEHGACFVCGSQNPHSIGVTWYTLENGDITAEVILSEAQQGPPSMAHGGASAALLDEAMGAAAWRAGHQVAAVNLNVNYHRPVPLGVTIQIWGRLSGEDGKAIFTKGEILLSDGTVAVSASGVYVKAEHLFTGLGIQKRKPAG